MWQSLCKTSWVHCSVSINSKPLDLLPQGPVTKGWPSSLDHASPNSSTFLPHTSSKVLRTPWPGLSQQQLNHLAPIFYVSYLSYPSDQATWWRPLMGRRALWAHSFRVSFHHDAEGRAAGDAQSAGNARLWLLLTLRTVGKPRGQTGGRDITLVVSSTLVTHPHQAGLMSQRFHNLPSVPPTGDQMLRYLSLRGFEMPLSLQIFLTELLP